MGSGCEHKSQMQKIPRQMTNVVLSPFLTSTFQHERTAGWQESVDVQRSG